MITAEELPGVHKVGLIEQDCAARVDLDRLPEDVPEVFEMLQAAEDLKFEKAALLRRSMSSSESMATPNG